MAGFLPEPGLLKQPRQGGVGHFLTGDKTAMDSVEKAARQLFAAQKADGRIPKGHSQR